jgi:hypothetical protein
MVSLGPPLGGIILAQPDPVMMRIEQTRLINKNDILINCFI